MMRLDTYLTENGIFASRTRAARAIEQGLVRVNDTVVKKCAFDVSENDKVEAGEDPIKYVGRGALKLLGAFESFGLNVEGMTCLDIGASTGGFTEVMLEKGAAKVYSVDVGSDQLAEKLKNDERVVNLEKTDIRRFGEQAEYSEYFDFSACDASFISLKLILPYAYRLVKTGALSIFLIKPQFETTRSNIGKGGIVKNPAAIKNAINDVTGFATKCGFKLEKDVIPSPIDGGDGNHEFLLLLRK